MIHPLIADAQAQLPDPNHFASIGWVVVTLFALCGGLYYVMALVDRVRGKDPEPPNSLLATSQKDLQRRQEVSEAAIAGIRSELKAEALKIEDIAARRSASIYNKIEGLRAEFTSELNRTREASNEAHEETRREVARGFQDVERSLGRLEGKMEK